MKTLNVEINCENCLETYWSEYDETSKEFTTDHFCPQCGAEPDDGMLSNSIHNARIACHEQECEDYYRGTVEN